MHPPIAVSEPDGSGRFLSDVERIAIADGLRAGRTHRKIAVELGRHPTTVSREVARNSDAVSGEYRPFAAHHQALARRARPKQRRADSNEELCRVVQERLDKRWSPEQIAAWLVAEYPDRDDMRPATNRSTRRFTRQRARCVATSNEHSRGSKPRLDRPTPLRVHPGSSGRHIPAPRREDDALSRAGRRDSSSTASGGPR